MTLNLLTANDKLGVYPSSYYAAKAQKLDRQPMLKGCVVADVCIIGAGFSGLSSALHLAKAGYKVVVLEAQRIAFGASGRNGGQVGNGHNIQQDDLQRLLGQTHARSLWNIANDAVQLVKDLSEDMPDCAVVDGVIRTVHKKRYLNEQHAYVDFLNTHYGYDKIIKLDRGALSDMVASPAYYGGILDMGSGHIDPLRFALGLARKALLAGVQIFEQSTVTQLIESDPSIIKTDMGEVRASFTILACNGYLGRLNKRVAAKIMPINNFIVATAPMTIDEQNALIKYNYAVADSKFVVNYFRFSDDHRLLFGGSESYGYSFPSDIVANVRKPLMQVFPQLRNISIDYAWGGTLAITMNRMPHFDRLKGNVLSISGYSGHGVAMATMAGKLAAEALQGQSEKFDAMAKVPSASFPGGEKFRSPLLILAMLWYSLRDRF